MIFTIICSGLICKPKEILDIVLAEVVFAPESKNPEG